MIVKRIILPDKDKITWTHELTRLINGKPEMEPSAASICIIDGWGFSVGKNGENICIGPVDIHGNPLPAYHDTTLEPINGVSKINNEELVGDNDSQYQEDGIMIHRRPGRPRIINGKMSRMTAWRRQQEEKQGVLL